jgi:hypothetical protein
VRGHEGQLPINLTQHAQHADIHAELEVLVAQVFGNLAIANHLAEQVVFAFGVYKTPFRTQCGNAPQHRLVVVR